MERRYNYFFLGRLKKKKKKSLQLLLEVCSGCKLSGKEDSLPD